MAQDADKFIIRLPDGMRDRIKATAATNKRSMNAELLALIESGIGATHLRDQFAGQALIGLAMRGHVSHKDAALIALRYADAMLKARVTV